MSIRGLAKPRLKTVNGLPFKKNGNLNVVYFEITEVTFSYINQGNQYPKTMTAVVRMTYLENGQHKYIGSLNSVFKQSTFFPLLGSTFGSVDEQSHINAIYAALPGQLEYLSNLVWTGDEIMPKTDFWQGLTINDFETFNPDA